jgi:hypothetical protein
MFCSVPRSMIESAPRMPVHKLDWIDNDRVRLLDRSLLVN